MYQTDDPTAVVALPTPAAPGTPGYFTDGNPGSGLQATILRADFMNSVMMELLNVITAAGITPSKTAYNQVLLAIQHLITVAAGTGTVTGVTGTAPITSTGGAAPAIGISAATDSSAGSMSAADKTKLDGIAAGATANTGTVTSLTIASANGISGNVVPTGGALAATLQLGAITPTTINASGNITTAGVLTCNTFNAVASDRRLKTDIRRVDPRPLHRFIRFVSYTLKIDGSKGKGPLAQSVKKFDPAYVGEFETKGKKRNVKRLSIDKQSMAYEQAMWAGHEIDRQAKLIAKLLKRVEKLEGRRA
jgi:hypothetical protein